jgi:hypothetical protein
MSQPTPLPYWLTRKLKLLMDQGTYRKMSKQVITNGRIERITLEEVSFTSNGNFSQIADDVFDGLTDLEIVMVSEIHRALKMNNALWDCTRKRTPRIRQALANLKAKGIIEKVPGSNVFVVNPGKICKGNLISISTAMIDYFSKMYLKDSKWKPTSVDIKRLAAPKELTLETNALLDAQLDNE